MKPIVISVGGSRIVPDKVDYQFLLRLRKLILKHKNKKIVICCGGGKTARIYMAPLMKERFKRNIIDEIGITTTLLNAKLLTSFLRISNPIIPANKRQIKRMLRKYRIVVCGGINLGMTSDGTTAQIARYLKAEALINLTNVKGLYDKDPNKFKNAKFIPSLTHKEFKKIIDKIESKSGMHFVLDHLAAKVTREAKIKVIIMGNLKSLDNYLSGNKFIGTTVY